MLQYRHKTLYKEHVSQYGIVILLKIKKKVSMNSVLQKGIHVKSCDRTYPIFSFFLFSHDSLITCYVQQIERSLHKHCYSFCSFTKSYQDPKLFIQFKVISFLQR